MYIFYPIFHFGKYIKNPEILLISLWFKSHSHKMFLFYFCCRFILKKVTVMKTESPFRCEIFGFFSSRSLKTREKWICFAQFVNFLKEVCLLFNFWMTKWAKLIYSPLVLREREEKKTNISHLVVKWKILELVFSARKILHRTEIPFV